MEINKDGHFVGLDGFEDLIDPNPSEEADNIIGKAPAWTLRWGSTCILLLLILALWSSYLIKYPDIVRAEIKISSARAPGIIKAKKEGRIKQLFVNDNSTVTRGQVLGYMESLADPERVLAMNSRINHLIELWNSGLADSIPFYFPLDYSSLGELQPDYKALTQEYIRYRTSLKSGFQSKKQLLLRKDLVNLSSISNNLKAQKALIEEDLAIEGEKLDMSNLLIKDKVISKSEFKEQQSRYLSKQIPVQQMNANLINSEYQIRQKEKELLEVENSISEQQSLFGQAVNAFKSKIQDWIDQHLLVAPDEGIISINTILQENQNISAGQELFYILPLHAQYRAIGYLPQFNFGKVRSKQKVVLKLSSYPYQEYGALEGSILSISSTPKDSGYLMLVVLDGKGLGSKANNIILKEGLSGTAEVITEDRRLIQKFFAMFRAI